MTYDDMHEVAQYLYKLLDDIDTASDVAKDNDHNYRMIVERLQQKKSDFVKENDGYRILFKPITSA